MKITPTCRYGHGELQESPRSPDNHCWGLIGATLTNQVVGATHFGTSIARVTEASGRVFTITLYRCPVCGYLEMFDDEALRG